MLITMYLYETDTDVKDNRISLVIYFLHHHLFHRNTMQFTLKCKAKVIPWQAEAALGVLGRLRPWIFSTFGTTRVVGQPNAPAAFTKGEIPGTHFQRLSRPQGTWFCRKKPWKKSQVTPPGIDPRTVRLVVQCLNHYATPCPLWNVQFTLIFCNVIYF